MAYMNNTVTEFPTQRALVVALDKIMSECDQAVAAIEKPQALIDAENGLQLWQARATESFVSWQFECRREMRQGETDTDRSRSVKAAKLASDAAQDECARHMRRLERERDAHLETISAEVATARATVDVLVQYAAKILETTNAAADGIGRGSKLAPAIEYNRSVAMLDGEITKGAHRQAMRRENQLDAAVARMIAAAGPKPRSEFDREPVPVTVQEGASVRWDEASGKWIDTPRAPKPAPASPVQAVIGRALRAAVGGACGD